MRQNLEHPELGFLSQDLKNHADEIKKCARMLGRDAEELYGDFLERYSIPDKKDFLDSLVDLLQEQNQSLSHDEISRIRSSFNLHEGLVFFRSSKLDHEAVYYLECVLDEIGIYHRSFGKSNSRDLARSLRQNKKSEVTTIIRQMIWHCLDHFSSGVEIALELVQPENFKKWQFVVWNQERLKVIPGKCVDGRKISFKDRDGQDYEYGLRSLENLVPIVRKERALSIE
ncbi:hypothetical protein [Bdellovibrio sp.]|uniref:hypothetical protein n=1 Tax=Bdellovibrio sp. TaxID=28201 RepID=UPI0039E295DD